jgi:lysozyme family protein
MSLFVNTVLRIVSVFGIQVMAIIGGASMIGGIPVYKAAILSGVAAVAQVLQKIAIAFADDGKLTREELDAAFSNHLVAELEE